jgi:hypothetical protein
MAPRPSFSVIEAVAEGIMSAKGIAASPSEQVANEVAGLAPAGHGPGPAVAHLEDDPAGEANGRSRVRGL